MKTVAANTDLVQHRAMSRDLRLTRVLLSCGIVASVLYVLTLSFGATRWPGYSAITQTISELFAIGAPTRALMIPPLTLYALLVYAFGIGVWRAAGGQRALKAAACLIIAKEVFGLLATVIFAMHVRGSTPDVRDTMHGLLTLVGVFLCMLPAMGLGAAAFGGRFRLYSVATILAFIAGGLLAFLAVPNIATNQATPLAGLSERINAFAYMLWTVVFAVVLLRRRPVGALLQTSASI